MALYLLNFTEMLVGYPEICEVDTVGGLELGCYREELLGFRRLPLLLPIPATQNVNSCMKDGTGNQSKKHPRMRRAAGAPRAVREGGGERHGEGGREIERGKRMRMKGRGKGWEGGREGGRGIGGK